MEVIIQNPETIEMNGLIYRLSDIEIDTWRLLLNAGLRSREPFHTCVAGTQSEDGVSLRTVVLRKASPEEKKLFFHTDIRSPKVTEIQAGSRISFLFYDESKRLQFRLWGKASVHFQDALAEKHWAESRLSSRKCYLSFHPPGHPEPFPTDSLPEHLQGRHEPSQEESELGWERFCVVECEIFKIDWLFLNSSGHRRCQFFYEKGLLKNAIWVAP
jgi:pyridoxamine 5'-phosphate oxidase